MSPSILARAAALGTPSLLVVVDGQVYRMTRPLVDVLTDVVRGVGADADLEPVDIPLGGLPADAAEDDALLYSVSGPVAGRRWLTMALPPASENGVTTEAVSGIRAMLAALAPQARAGADSGEQRGAE